MKLNEIPGWIKGIVVLLTLVGGTSGVGWTRTNTSRAEAVNVAGVQQDALKQCYAQLDACYAQLRQCR